MTIEVSAQNPRSVKALLIFAASHLWQQGHTKDGRPFFGIPSCSEPGLFHMVDQRECTCQDFKRRGGVDAPCKHVIAVRFWFAAFQTGAVAPKPRPATPDVTDDAGIGDDLVALTPDGAEYLIEQRASDEEPAPETDGAVDLAFAETATRLRGDAADRPLKRYEDIWTDDALGIAI